MVEIEDAEDREEIGVGDAFTAHNAEGVGIDNLLPERASAEVWSLRDVEDLCEGRFADCAAINWPEATEDPEERGFSTPVWSNY